jgi:hypothetical protein
VPILASFELKKLIEYNDLYILIRK